MPLYPSKVLQNRERALTLCLSVVFCLGLTFESLKELGARHLSIFSKSLANCCLEKWWSIINTKWHSLWQIGFFYVVLNLLSYYTLYPMLF
jgi:hypothetical protein